MKKLILTFEVLNGVDRQTAFNHGIALAQAAMEAMGEEIVNPFVGIEVKAGRRTHVVEVS